MSARSIFMISSVSVFLAGCATVPRVSVFDLPVSEAVLNIRCEIRNAVWDYSEFNRHRYPTDMAREAAIKRLASPRFSKEWFENMAATIDLTLKVEQTDAAKADGSFTFPLPAAPGVAKLAINGGHSSKATRTEVFNFAETLSEFPIWKSGGIKLVREPILQGDYVKQGTPMPRKGEKPIKSMQVKTVYKRGLVGNPSLKFQEICDDYDQRPSENRLLTGNLGVRDFLQGLEQTYQRTKVIPKGLSYSVEFVITANSDIGPSFNLIPIMPETFSGGFKLDSKRGDTHTMKITFAKLQGYNNLISIAGVHDFSTGSSVQAEFMPSTKSGVSSDPPVIVQGIPEANRRINRAISNRIILDQLDPTLTAPVD